MGAAIRLPFRKESEPDIEAPEEDLEEQIAKVIREHDLNPVSYTHLSSGQPWAGGWNPVGIIPPTGVAPYELQADLPGELKGKLPTARQLADMVRVEMEGGK